MAFLGILLFSPVLAIVSAVTRGVILFLPLMFALNLTHREIPVLPNLSAWGCFLIIVVVSLLLPGGTSVKSE